MNLEDVQPMSDKELNETIAQLCGYVKLNTKELVSRLKDMGSLMANVVPEQVYWNNPAGQIVAVPDFCNSLDLMHIAERIIKPNCRDLYACYLWGETKRESAGWEMAHATARHRAEAFVMLLGKSNED